MWFCKDNEEKCEGKRGRKEKLFFSVPFFSFLEFQSKPKFLSTPWWIQNIWLLNRLNPPWKEQYMLRSEITFEDIWQVHSCAWMYNRWPDGTSCGDTSLYSYCHSKESIHVVQGLAPTDTRSNQPWRPLSGNGLYPDCRFDNPYVATFCRREHCNGCFLELLHRIIWISHSIPGS